MIEVALVFDKQGKPLYWHVPQGVSGGAIPDSQVLWAVLWEARDVLGGIAHSHPWDGQAYPSTTDTTTWAAIEAGLGTRLVWPIVTMNCVGYFGYSPTEQGYTHVAPVFFGNQDWVEDINELRRLSQGG